MYTGFLWRINRAASVEDNMFGLGHMVSSIGFDFSVDPIHRHIRLETLRNH
jgi:hypothetical protein